MATLAVNITYDALPIDEDLKRLKDLARAGGSGVDLGDMTDSEIISRLFGR